MKSTALIPLKLCNTVKIVLPYLTTISVISLFETKVTTLGLPSAGISGPECANLMEPLNDTIGLDLLFGNTCERINAGFNNIEDSVARLLGGASCSFVLTAAKEYLNSVVFATEMDEAEREDDFNGCFRLTYMSDDDIERLHSWYNDINITSDDLKASAFHI
jgi:hypothetical protein